MPNYSPPVKDMTFILEDVLDVVNSDVPGYDELETDFISAVLN